MSVILVLQASGLCLSDIYLMLKYASFSFGIYPKCGRIAMKWPH